MARSRKKTIEQRVVGVAALGLPAPVQRVVGSRWGARLFLLVAAVLFSAGIIHVQWTNGRPQIKVDKKRAQEVKQNIVSEIESAEGIKHDRSTKFHWLESAEKPAEPGLIREAFGHRDSQQNPADKPFFPRLGAAGEATDRFRDFSAKVIPQPSENQPPARPTKLPWLR